MKQFWVLAGSDGAGKSTFYKLMLKRLGMPFINADLIARKLVELAALLKAANNDSNNLVLLHVLAST